MKTPGKILSVFFKTDFSFFIRLGIGVLGFLLFSEILSRVVYPFDSGHYEAFSWMSARHLLEGANPYSFAFTPPYSMSPYGIVYYGLLAVGIKFFGFQLWWGRTWSVLGFAVCLWAIVKITKKLTQSRQAAQVACLAGLAMYAGQLWIAFARPDLIAAAFCFVALYLAFTFEEDRKTSLSRLIWIVLLLAAAFFTKQIYLLPVFIVFLRFLQIGKYREAAYFVAALVFFIAGIGFGLNYTSAGGYFWQHFTHAKSLPFAFEILFSNFLTIFKSPTFFFFIVFLLVFIYQKRNFFYRADYDKLLIILREPRVLILFYFLLSFGWTVLSAGRVGANINYFLEISFVAAIACGIIYQGFISGQSQKFALALVILLTLGGMFQMARVLRGEYFRWQDLVYYQEIFDATAKLTPPGSLCVSAYPEMVVWNGCDFNFDDYTEYTSKWSPELNEIFEREMKSGRYATVLWFDDQLQAKFPNYRLVPMTQKLQKGFPVFLYVRAAPPQ